MKSAIVFVMIIAGTLGAGCKQGKGERCQVDNDCTSPLVCNQATQTCDSSGGSQLDANLPIDAKPIDAP